MKRVRLTDDRLFKLGACLPARHAVNTAFPNGFDLTDDPERTAAQLLKIGQEIDLYDSWWSYGGAPYEVHPDIIVSDWVEWLIDELNGFIDTDSDLVGSVERSAHALALCISEMADLPEQWKKGRE